MTAIDKQDKTSIPLGRTHRALRDIEMHVYDYDDMGIEARVLLKDSLFRPWEPLAQWQGDKIPITLGDQATEFNWMITSREGHFLKWNDFFDHCELVETVD